MDSYFFSCNSKWPTILLCLVLSLVALDSYGQTGCDCPEAGTCGPCTGGLTSLTIRYTGGPIIGLTVTVSDGGGVLFSGLALTIGNTPFTVTSSAGAGQLFVGNFVTVSGTLLFNETLATDCTDPVTPGTAYQYFEIVSSVDQVSGTVCCAPADDDQVDPTFSTPCPGNIQAFTAAGSCTAAVSWTPPTATDNCGGNVTLTSTHDPGSSFPIGTTTVTYTATDEHNNSSTCNFNVEVIDNIAPSITSCPADADVSVDASCNYTIPTYTATVSDNCGATLTQSPVVGTVISGHNTSQLVTLTATDAAGNASSCSFTITLKDNIAPTITSCPVNADVFVDASCNYTIPTYTATVTDNCGATLTQSPVAGTVISGHNTSQLVTLTATDVAGNTASCSFTITLKDNIAPSIISCPVDADVFVDASCNYTIPTYTATVNDNCGTATLTQSPVAGTVINGHNTTQLVTLTATDVAGNTASCSFTITLKDNIAPAITSCPVNADVFVNASCNYTIPTYTATVNDNCGAATLTQSPVAGTVINGHNTTQLITLTATDVAGNTASCSFTITLKDNIAPSITSCPANTDVFLNASCNYTIPAYAATISDNCGAATLTQSPVAGTVISGHNTSQLVTLTATDAAGNSSSCSFTITLKDNIAPAITSCPTNTDVFVNASCNYAIPTYTATVTDNCGATLTQSPVAGTVISGHNTSQLITLTSTDAAGNSSSCAFTITLKDNIAPTITSCPVNADVFLDASCNYTIPTYTATVSDNCGTATLTQSPVSGTVISGHNTSRLITLTATDAAGNTSTCSFTITLKDNLAPVFTNCPPDIVRDALPSCRASATWTTPTVSDNCTSFPSMSVSHTSGSMFDFGVTVVTYTVTDGAGNTSSCSFRVTVRNNSPPTFTGCPEDIRLEAGETGEVSATWTEPVISNTCGNVTVTASHAPGDLFPVGTTEVTYVATRDDGATASCTFQVIVAYQNVTFEVVQLITPNGDGIHDKLTVKNLESYSDNNVVIVDRWGGLIYSASGYNNESVAWDGTNKNGAEVPTGTYFYTITVVFRGQKTIKKGYIELIRQ